MGDTFLAKCSPGDGRSKEVSPKEKYVEKNHIRQKVNWWFRLIDAFEVWDGE